MGLITKFFKLDNQDKIEQFIDNLIRAKSKQLLIKQHAINRAIDLIAKTIAKSEIIIYKINNGKIEETINRDYYVLNIKPNDNQDGTVFWYKVLKRYLGNDGEALIIALNEKLYLADSFECTDTILFEKLYYDIVISDERGNSIKLNKKFRASDVIYLNSKCTQTQKVLDDYYKELGSLIGISASKYKLTNTSKFRLRFSGGQPAFKDPNTQKDITYEEYKQKLTNGLFDEEDAVILLSENFGLDKIDLGQVQSSDDWSKLEKKWSDKVAMSFNIPLDIFYGNKTDKSTSTNDFFSFAILPHLQIFEDSLNSKIVSIEDFIKGECIKINRFNMKHFDILDSASNMDKLFSNGWSRNEINKIIGMPRIDAKWADKHYITKNYEDAEIVLKGGDDE